MLLFAWGIESLKDCFELLAYIATIAALSAVFYAALDFKNSRRGFEQTVMEHCLERYWELRFKERPDCGEWYNQYMEFVNEELFYFQLKYLPLSVAIEWLDGIANHVVIQLEEENVTYGAGDSENFDKMLRAQIVFPRIQKAFTFSRKTGDDIELIRIAFGYPSGERYEYARRYLILRVLKKLRTVTDAEKMKIMNSDLIMASKITAPEGERLVVFKEIFFNQKGSQDPAQAVHAKK